MEIQTINMEKKQLMHQWNSSLTGMKRRDEAYTAMQEALRYSIWKWANEKYSSTLNGSYSKREKSSLKVIGDILLYVHSVLNQE